MLENKIMFKMYELKGMFSSFKDSALHHDQYNFPMVQKMEVVLNEVISLIDKGQKEQEKVIYPSTYSIPRNFQQSRGFNSKTNA